MANSKSKQKAAENRLEDMITELEELDLWDFADPADQAFWEEFFKVENVIETADEIDAPSFTITVQNHDTGEVKTYSNIKLKPSRRKISC